MGQKESYNVRDLITMEVKNLPNLTYFAVLQVIAACRSKAIALIGEGVVCALIHIFVCCPANSF